MKNKHMIKSIFIFNTNSELIIEKHYHDYLHFSKILNIIKSNRDLNFCEYENDTIIYKKFDDLFISFVVFDENEMYILSLINLLMSAMEKLLGGINQRSFVYHFKDISYALDNFIINGKIINLDSLEISISPHFIKSFRNDE